MDIAREKFRRRQDGQSLMQTKTIAHLGGATLDNEENYLIKKLFTGGLGMVCVATRPGYDTALPCPVWAHHSDEAEPRLRRMIFRTPTQFSSWDLRWPRTIRSAFSG